MSFSDLDHRLRAEGDRWRSQFPAPDTFAERLAAAQQTGSRRLWLAPLAAAAAMVALVAGTVLVARPGHHSIPTAGPVPWSSATVPVPAPTGSSAVTSEPECHNIDDFQLGQVNVARGLPTGVDQPEVLRVALRYRGTSACNVTIATFVLSLLDQNGRVIDADPLEVSNALHPTPTRLSPHRIEPGQTLIFASVWIDSCDGPAGPPRLRIDVAGKSNGPTARLAVGDKPGCPSRDSREVPTLSALEPVVAAPGSMEALVASIDAPATARRGQPLPFTVTITNLSDKPVRLDPCPTYTIALVWGLLYPVRAVPAETSHLLNCAQGPRKVAAGASSEWAMQVVVPVNDQPYHALSWTWGGGTAGDARGTSSHITIVP